MPADEKVARMRALIRDVIAQHPDAGWLVPADETLRDALAVQHAASKLFAGHPLTLNRE